MNSGLVWTEGGQEAVPVRCRAVKGCLDVGCADGGRVGLVHTMGGVTGRWSGFVYTWGIRGVELMDAPLPCCKNMLWERGGWRTAKELGGWDESSTCYGLPVDPLTRVVVVVIAAWTLSFPL